jgi:hypothetical protein
MTRIQLSFEPRAGTGEGPVKFDVLDPATALVIAEINAEDGPAELWDGEKRLARLVKQGADDAPFWKVS